MTKENCPPSCLIRTAVKVEGHFFLEIRNRYEVSCGGLSKHFCSTTSFVNSDCKWQKLPGKSSGTGERDSVEWVVQLLMWAMEDNVTLSLPLYVLLSVWFLFPSYVSVEETQRTLQSLGGDSASGFCLQPRIEDQTGDLGRVQPIHSWSTLSPCVSFILFLLLKPEGQIIPPQIPLSTLPYSLHHELHVTWE